MYVGPVKGLTPRAIDSRTGILVCMVGVSSGHKDLQHGKFAESESLGVAGNGQLIALLCEDHSEQLCRRGLARVVRDLMGASRRFEKHLAGIVSSLWLSGDLGDHGTFEHIGQHEAGVMMHLSYSTGRIVDIADRYLPILHGDIWQIVSKIGLFPGGAGGLGVRS